MYPLNRNRRLRSSSAIRALVRENHLSNDDFIVPLFIVEKLSPSGRFRSNNAKSNVIDRKEFRASSNDSQSVTSASNCSNLAASLFPRNESSSSKSNSLPLRMELGSKKDCETIESKDTSIKRKDFANHFFHSWLEHGQMGICGIVIFFG